MILHKDKEVSFETLKMAYKCGLIDDSLQSLESEVEELIKKLDNISYSKDKNGEERQVFLEFESKLYDLLELTAEKYFNYGSLIENKLESY